MKSEINRKIIVSVTSDLVSDNRVHKVCTTLSKMGFKVLLAGRKLPGSLELDKRVYSTRRFKLLFNKGPLFYACYNFRLFLLLFFSKFDVLLSNDLDTLPANFLVSRLRRKPLVYDSHEYFTEVPELVNRPVVKRIWEWLEQMMVPHLSDAYTVCESIAEIYSRKYKVPFQVVRNFPVITKMNKNITPEEEEKIILYQGAVNEARGLEQAICAMAYLEGVHLVIAGDGDKRKELERLTEKKGLSGKVKFLGKLPINELAGITPKASVGLSIEEDIGLNYHFALPNKLFDYIQSRVPVLVTDLPEMAALVRRYEIGEIIADLTPLNLSEVLAEMLGNIEKRQVWQKNLEVASQDLVWEKEERIIDRIFRPFLLNIPFLKDF